MGKINWQMDNNYTIVTRLTCLDIWLDCVVRVFQNIYIVRHYLIKPGVQAEPSNRVIMKVKNMAHFGNNKKSSRITWASCASKHFKFE